MLILYYKIEREQTQNIDQMTKVAQLPLHYNLKRNLKRLESKCNKKKLILIQIKLMNLIIRVK